MTEGDNRMVMRLIFALATVAKVDPAKMAKNMAVDDESKKFATKFTVAYGTEVLKKMDSKSKKK